MRRKMTRARRGYLKTVQSQGLVYTHEDKHGPSPELYRYWRDDAYYEMTAADIDVLERASAALFEMFVEAGDWLLSEAGAADLAKFQIPVSFMRAVIASWNEEPARGSVYGRFDLRFGGVGHPDPPMRIPKLYEFNADTPTSLVESLVQWNWFEDNRALGDTQWTNMYEDLVAAWTRNLALIEEKLGRKPVVHFACSSADYSHEDEMNTLVLRDTCAAAGYETRTIYLESINHEPGRGYLDEHGDHIDVLFKLYPWEFLVREPGADNLVEDLARAGYGDDQYTGGTIWIEAPYKLIWSTKAMLPVLWKLFKDDQERAQYLLPCWHEDEVPVLDLRTGFVRKPILAREGADITLTYPGGETAHGEVQGYGDEGFIAQELAVPPMFHRDDERVDVHTVLGVWMVDGEPSGLAIRESSGPITDNFANFIPHVVKN